VSADSTNYHEAKYLVGRAHHYTYGDGGDPVTGSALATEALAYAVLALVDTLAQPQPEEKATAEAATATPELTIYRAAHESLVLGWYTNAAEARRHCATLMLREQPSAALDWIEDEEDDVAELAATVDGEENPTGYLVTALTVASEYDEGADE
jgi:hypothetical protein